MIILLPIVDIYSVENRFKAIDFCELSSELVLLNEIKLSKIIPKALAFLYNAAIWVYTQIISSMA